MIFCFIAGVKKDAASIMRLPRDINHPNIRFAVFLNFGATLCQRRLNVPRRFRVDLPGRIDHETTA